MTSPNDKPAALFDPRALAAAVDPAWLKKVRQLFSIGAGDAPHQARGKRLLRLLLGVALAGLAAAGTAFAKGHHVMGTNSELPWGVLIATYVFFVASTSGLCLVGSLGHVFGFRLFEPIAKKSIFLALMMLVVGFSVIASELERPVLLLRMAIFSPNPSSPIWWMGTLYGLYTFVLAAELYFLLVEDHSRAKVAGVVGLLAAVAAQSNLGAVFGLTHARPYWYGPLVPVYFISLALVSGAALLMLVVYFEDFFSHARQLRPEHAPLMEGLRKLLVLFLSIALFFTFWRTVAGIQGAHEHRYQVTLASLTGPMFVSFWLFEIFLGNVVPLAILLGPRKKEPGYLALAGALPILGILVMRLNFVYAGQMFSLKPLEGRLGEALTYAPPFKGNGAGFLAYTPSLVEALIVVGALAAATLLYVGGSRVLRLGVAAGVRASPEEGSSPSRVPPGATEA